MSSRGLEWNAVASRWDSVAEMEDIAVDEEALISVAERLETKVAGKDIDVKVVARRVEGGKVVVLELASCDGCALPEFEAGAHIDVHLGCGLQRQYSLMEGETERGRYTIGVLWAQDSRGGSEYIYQRLNEGVRLKISQPRNAFALHEGAGRSLLFAGGIGITPILAMAECLAARGKSFELHYSARSRDHAALRRRIEGTSVWKNTRWHFDDEPGTALNLEKVLADAAEKDHLYVCGPSGYMDYVLTTAAQLGWPQTRLHREHFSAPVASPGGEATETGFSVVLARSGMTVEVPPGRSIVSALAEAGVKVPFSCEQGLCGACLTRVIDGTPDHRDFYLSDEEHDRNDQMTLCCSRSLTASIVLDI